MPAQSRAQPVPLLLTRPDPQGADFGHAVQTRFGDAVRIVRTPLLAPRFYAPALPPGPFAGLIVTSQTGVDAYQRLGAAKDDLPRDAYCVGTRTADAARVAGLTPGLIAPNAASLTALIKAQPPKGVLLHLRGRDTRGNILDHLNLAGIDTFDAVVYAQEAQALTDEAQTILRVRSPVLVPLFSPRTAAIFAGEMARTCGISPLFVVAMSGDVALALRSLAAEIRVAETPDASAMLDTVAMLLSDMKRA